MMEVDLRLAKGYRLSPSTERNRFHTKNRLIEADCYVYVAHRKHEVIQAVNLHDGFLGLMSNVKLSGGA